jgi:ABC-2 type transport system ATP-binding protein
MRQLAPGIPREAYARGRTTRQAPSHKVAAMLTIEALTIRYGDSVAVDDLTVAVQPGRVTGLLGANGAGKSTTLRAILALVTPTRGRALIDGRPYRRLDRPLQRVGALLDAGQVHPGRTAFAHLRWLAAAGSLPTQRVDEVLGVVGLADVAGRRVGRFSLGMRQRLGIAAALLGDPGILLVDEPLNGLDPEGVRWMRTLLRDLAAQGRTVLMSSHLLTEIALTVDHVVVLGGGRLLADTSLAELRGGHSSLEDAYLALTASGARHRSASVLGVVEDRSAR